ncbi:penicillin acylase family protein [Virgibacillus dokdonensis]|uniref:Penicillin acylase family protein n=1 Tax=Virgibacillus dokdonensis TaxID=302167 RepID=A0A3E0WXE3_9BACI|nr:penicillin acylase family protein [Virgibacillus dokdonensis]RFA36665.1 penicillin acylase family protein [Virgibacillus dokdonensis]
MEEKPIKQTRKKTKITIIIFGMITLLFVTAFFIVAMYLDRLIEKTEGSIELSVLQQKVDVITDANGVPKILAQNEHDLYVAQGYVQAQYRLFQMDMSRRQASGTISEVAGEAAVDQDKYFRTLGLRRAAEKSYDLYSNEAKEVLEAFAKGVNAYMQQAKKDNTLPIEFKLMGFEPEKWTPLDSLTIGKYMAFDLGGHWEQQAFNYYLLQHFGEEKAYELFPSYPQEKPVIMEEKYVSVEDKLFQAIIPPAFNGSNNWVVSGEKTASGFPMLADDPHLGLATPSIWIQMQLQTETQQVSGVIFAGVPGIILGHNEQIAWGVTNTGPDVQQLYLEKRKPDSKAMFLFEGEWEKANIIQEPIAVKDGKTIDYEVVETRHGPVISEFAEDSGEENVLSLKWTALDATTELEAILQINKAKDWETFEKGLEKFLVPAQNFVFASKEGTIAYKANGNIPIYENGKDALLPLPGWQRENEWRGYIPFDELPTMVNPEKGYIATANNKITTEEYPYHISNVWAQPYRYERIAEVLESVEKITVQGMQDLQMDSFNMQAKELIPAFLQLLEGRELSKQATEALHLLDKWDYKDDASATQPLLFHHWYKNIEKIIYQEIPDSMLDLFKGKGQTTDALLRKAIKGESSVWLETYGGLQQILLDSLQQSITELERKYGDPISEWKWGDYHRVYFEHPLSNVHPVLAYVFNQEAPIPVDGSNVTPMAASFEEETGIVDHGASWRFVIDMETPSKGYHIVAPGQSGHVKSRWYQDQVQDWVKGDYHTTYLDNMSGEQLILYP